MRFIQEKGLKDNQQKKEFQLFELYEVKKFYLYSELKKQLNQCRNELHLFESSVMFRILVFSFFPSGFNYG